MTYPPSCFFIFTNTIAYRCSNSHEYLYFCLHLLYLLYLTMSSFFQTFLNSELYRGLFFLSSFCINIPCNTVIFVCSHILHPLCNPWVATVSLCNHSQSVRFHINNIAICHLYLTVIKSILYILFKPHITIISCVIYVIPALLLVFSNTM